MTQRRAPGDLDLDPAFDDPDNGWFGHVQPDDPVLRGPAEIADLPSEDADPKVGAIRTEDTDRWPVLTVDTTPTPDPDDRPGAEAPDRRPPDRAPAASWGDVATPLNDGVGAPVSMSWESRLAHSGAWDFKVSKSGPGMRPKLAVAAVFVAGLAVAGVVLLARSAVPAVDQSTVVSPNESTAQPTKTSTAPALSTASDAPPPPGLPTPPPPPPSAEEINPPVVTRDDTPRRQNTPQESDKPEIDVTRTPTTRSQMSATPPSLPRIPDRNSSTPGDSGRRGGFGFGF